MKLEDFLIQEEGDDSRHLPDGRVAATWDSLGHVWNIGPGLTQHITKDTVLTHEQLQAAEDAEFAATRAAVASLVKVPLGENQTTAVESLVYNIGVSGFAHSTVLRDINSHDFSAVPAAFRLWNKAGGEVVRGLIKRREDEIRLWLHPDDVPPPPDLTTPKNVPQAFVTTTQETNMAGAISTAGVNVSTTTVINTLIGNLTSAIITIGAPIFAMMQGSTTTHYIAGGLGFLAGLGSLITNSWNFISHNSAASSNTLQTISNLTQMAGQVAVALEPASVNPTAQ
jgi:GH24 family phage-related lysozyme (muramidase)